MAYNAYPAIMNHPGYAPAVLADDGKGKIAVGEEHAVGSPVRFPPVTVFSEDQEEEYAAKGYRKAGGDPAAFQVAKAVKPRKPNASFQEYPKWVGDRIVNDEDEEADALAKVTPAPEATKPAPADAPGGEALARALGRVAELEARLGLMSDPYASVDQIRAALTLKANVFGVTLDKRWGIERIIQAIVEAVAAEPSNAGTDGAE